MGNRVKNAIYTPDGKNGQKVAFTTSATDSAAIPAQASAVRLYASEDCYISFDGAAEKTGSVSGAITSGLSLFLPARQTEYFAIQGSTVISVAGDTASGNLSIMPMTE